VRLLAPARGEIRVAGRTLPRRRQAFIAAGLAACQRTVAGSGVIGDFAIWENAAERHREPRFS
jgi:hypothetical protein